MVERSEKKHPRTIYDRTTICLRSEDLKEF